MRKRQVKKSENKKSVKKYREKSVQEHAQDGIVQILKHMSKDDNVMYFAIPGTHECTFNGSASFLKVQGRAKVAFFTHDNKECRGNDGQGFETYYEYSGSVKMDSWGQDRINVDDYNVKDEEIVPYLPKNK